MTRRLMTTAAVIIGFGALVALVRAQDGTTRSVLRSINDASQEPRLSSPPSSTRAISSESGIQSGTSRFGALESESESEPATSRRSSLADRLKSVRDSNTSVPEPSRTIGSDSEQSISPIVSNPTRLDAQVPGTGSSGSTLAAPRIADERGGFGFPTSQQVAPDQSSGNATSGNSARRVSRSPIPSARSANEAPSESTLGQPDVLPESVQAPAFRPAKPEPSPSDRRVPANNTLFSSVGPMIRVDTVGPPAIAMGKSADYQITVTNLGQTAAAELYVRVSLPNWIEVDGAVTSAGTTQVQPDSPGQQKLVWTIDQIAPQGQQQLKLSVRPDSNRPFDFLVDWTLRPISNVAQVEVQQPRLEMAVFGPKDILFGDTATYTIQLTNPGNGDAENVALEFAYGTRRLEKKLIGRVGPGEQSEINVELTAQQAGLLRVAAIATADGGLRAEANEDVTVRRAELEVAVIGSPLKFAGSLSTYKVRVKNTGNAAANGVVASIMLPPGAKLLTGAAGEEAGQLQQEIGTLVPGAEKIISVQCQLATPGENRIDAVAKSPLGLESSGSFTTRVEALADLKLTVTDPSGPTALGQDAIYEIQIVNRGTKAAEGVQVVAQFSEGVEPIEANGHGADIVTGQVLFHPIARVEPGKSLVLKIVAKGELPGNHRFRAELTCTDPDTRLIAEESTYYFGDEMPSTTARSTDGKSTR